MQSKTKQQLQNQPKINLDNNYYQFIFGFISFRVDAVDTRQTLEDPEDVTSLSQGEQRETSNHPCTYINNYSWNHLIA